MKKIVLCATTDDCCSYGNKLPWLFPGKIWWSYPLYLYEVTWGKILMRHLKKWLKLDINTLRQLIMQDGKFYKMTPEEFKSALDELGLIPLSAHMGGVSLENADQQIADAKAAGFKYFVLPVPPGDFFAFDRENRSIKMKGDIAELTDS